MSPSYTSVTVAEARSNTAATAASMIPFHCIICFDEFNTTDRPPMVLPCGHTYVCLPCTKRLKRCMECREPLFMPLPNNNYSSSTSILLHDNRLSFNSNNNRGYALPARASPPSQGPPIQQPPQQNIPLPVPKNLVLLAMMEAAELQASRSNDEHHYENVSRMTREENRRLQEKQEREEEIRVVAGMATLAGPCGTYAVRDRQGLVVLLQDPRQPSPAGVLKESYASNVSEIDASDSFLDHIVTPSSSTDNPAVARSPRSAENKVTFPGGLGKKDTYQSEDKSSYRIQYGQKLQVVSFEDNVAVLARNEGFVIANHSQLVKIGGPLDDSCFLEGLLDTVTAQGRDMQLHLQENAKLTMTLQLQLQKVQNKPPAHPIVSDAPDPPPPPANGTSLTPSNGRPASASPKTPDYQTLLQPSLQSPPEAVGSFSCIRTCLSHDQGNRKPSGGFIRDVSVCPPMPESPASIDNADLDMGRHVNHLSIPSRSEEEHAPISLGCGTDLLSAADFLSTRDEEDTPRSPLVVRGLAAKYRQDSSSGARLVSSTSSMSPRTPNAGGYYQQHHQHQHPLAAPSSSFDSVDFRTGLSGHSGLAIASKRSFKHSPNQQPGVRRMMGVHGGILGGAARHQRASAASYNHWSVTAGFLPS